MLVVDWSDVEQREHARHGREDELLGQVLSRAGPGRVRQFDEHWNGMNADEAGVAGRGDIPSSKTEGDVKRVRRVAALLPEPTFRLECVGIGVVLFSSEHSPSLSSLMRW